MVNIMEKIILKYEQDSREDRSLGYSDSFETEINLQGLDEANQLVRVVGQMMRFITLLGYNYPTIKEYIDVYYESLLQQVEEDKVELEEGKDKVVEGFKLDSPQ